MLTETTGNGVIKALTVLNEVTEDLIDGITEAELVRRFEGKIVVPGVNVRQHLMELRRGSCLRESSDGKIFLRDECNPFKFFGAI